jgi:hypothetical protein
MEANKKEAKTNVLKAIGGGGLLSGLVGSPTKAGGGMGGLLGSPTNAGETDDTKKIPGALSEELGLVGLGAPKETIAVSSPTGIEQTETVVTKAEEEKTKNNPGIELWMESEDEKPENVDADDQSEQEIERVYQIIEKKQTQVGPLDDDSSIADNGMQTLGFTAVEKTMTSSAMFVDEKDQNIITTSEVITEQKSSFNRTTVTNTETTETTNFQETITNQEVFIDESVNECEEITIARDIRFEGTTKIETITTTTTITDEKTGEVLDTKVNIEEIVTENYDGESETVTES